VENDVGDKLIRKCVVYGSIGKNKGETYG